MGVLRAARGKLDTKRVVGLITELPAFVWSRIRLWYYWLKEVVGAGQLVSFQGIRVDLSADVFDDELRSLVRKGRYEADEIKFVRRYMPAGADVIELGAGVGAVTAAIERELASGTHVAVEANMQLIPILERTLTLNEASANVVHAAYATAPTVALDVGDRFWSARSRAPRVDTEAGGTISGVNLDGLCRRYDIAEFVLVADIEGAEHELFEKEFKLLADRCRLIIVELHETGGDPDAVRERLADSVFARVNELPAQNVVVYRNTSVR